MNKRALVYLGLASVTLAGAYLYIQSLQTETKSTPSPQSDSAQALESLSIVNGSLTTGPYHTTIRRGQLVQFLVHSDQTDSLIIKGLDTRVPLPGNQTTLVSIKTGTVGNHDIELDLSGTTIGHIEVTP